MQMTALLHMMMMMMKIDAVNSGPQSEFNFIHHNFKLGWIDAGFQEKHFVNLFIMVNFPHTLVKNIKDQRALTHNSWQMHETFRIDTLHLVELSSTFQHCFHAMSNGDVCIRTWLCAGFISQFIYKSICQCAFWMHFHCIHLHYTKKSLKQCFRLD